MSTRTILVTGATGKQGGALINELAGKNFSLRAMTRKPDSEAAQRLRADGVEIVEADLESEDQSAASVRAWAVAPVAFASEVPASVRANNVLNCRPSVRRSWRSSTRARPCLPIS